MARMGCAYHCRACGAHFGSLESFDAHRQFEEGHKDDWDYRICVEPMDDEKFAPKTRNGVCNLVIGPSKSDVTIWTLARKQQQWRERSDVSRVAA